MARRHPPNNHPSCTIRWRIVRHDDFNSHHAQWRYKNNDQNETRLVEWAEANSMHLVFNAKNRCTFRSTRWNTETNVDLCYVSTDTNGICLQTARTVLNDFPHTQHRPILLEIGVQIPLIKTTPVPRWNLKKARWEQYEADLDKTIRWIPPKASNYCRFAKLLVETAKKHIPRGFRKEYIPCWNDTSERLYKDFLENGRTEVADNLLHSLNDSRRQKWIETVENLDLKHSSRRAWSLMKKLGDSTHVPVNKAEVTPNQVANHIGNMSRATSDKSQSGLETTNRTQKPEH